MADKRFYKLELSEKDVKELEGLGFKPKQLYHYDREASKRYREAQKEELASLRKLVKEAGLQ